MRDVLGVFLVVAVVLVGGCADQSGEATTGEAETLSSESDQKKCLKYKNNMLKKLQPMDKGRCFTQNTIESVCKSAIGWTVWGSFANKVKDECSLSSVRQACDLVGGRSPTAADVANTFYEACMSVARRS